MNETVTESNKRKQGPKKRSEAQSRKLSFRTSPRTLEKVGVLCELKGVSQRELLERLINDQWRMNRPLIQGWMP